MMGSLISSFRKADMKERTAAFFFLLVFVGITAALIVNPTFASSSYVSTIKDIADDFINIITTIFQFIGLIITVFGAGNLILAFKNDDPNAKAQASMQLVVGIALIALPGIIKTLDLTSKIG